jgi:hypothetical protein
LIHFLKSNQVKTTQRVEGWNSRVKKDPECHQVPCLVRSQIPPYFGAVQPLASGSRGQKGWYLTGASRNVEEILSEEKPSNTQRSRTNQILFYTNSEFVGFLNSSAGHQVTRNVLVVNRLASAGAET